MHDWYTSSTMVEAPTSSLIGTCFLMLLAYMDEDSSCCGIGAWLMYLLGTSGDACLVHDSSLIDGICLDDST
jgi:hypothetical protein